MTTASQDIDLFIQSQKEKLNRDRVGSGGYVQQVLKKNRN
jgi:hypothetical protein